ncbi:Pre-miRNA 5'-monophosphate methyltransferase [Camelus dromedarius]|uniref:RNA methyltransferase n=3 Tax=Camelus TaxID=9836 RepID=S9YQJ4_CAMFR|nr:RNA 5'-monophosphate methyltransferase [Camelus ferus]XP_010988010.2 RNA 5'-monophosphate methyltransferase [Camelus dromedarius]EPY86220.1 pre-miRNA 5-monophosphate methyltransferase [Camelus ferus]KAB1270167.1 Pre-miRNA 5'-monophosphate methyltransferase [Camelus dromedarius]
MAASMKRATGGVEEASAEKEQRALEPGAAPFGNFPHYSRFHPPEQRLLLLPPELLHRLFPQSPETRPILGLDVGCNSGDLSVALYKHFLSLHDGETCSDASKELHLLCCDIDPVLVERAEKECPFPDGLTFITLDFMNQRTRKILLGSFLSQFGRSVFDIGFCMSVTMWIHLNHGDQGLWEFLAHLSSLCRYLLVEPQPWKCYRAAARRLRKLGLHDFDHFHSLAIRGDMANQIVQILTQDHGMELVCCFGNTSWDRSLLLFRAKQTTATHSSPDSLIEEGKERNRLRFWRQ